MTDVPHMFWVERYRPKAIEDVVLPDRIKKMFRDIIQTGTIPSMTLSGGAGMGKTTVARALCEELGYEYILINGSDEGRLIDTLRSRILDFVSRVSFDGSRKVVILDEADQLPQNTVQTALRAFTEQHSENASFILTCNEKNRLITPLLSRCPVIDFHFAKDEVEELQMMMFKRLKRILKENSVPFDPQLLVKIVVKFFPDFRRTLNEIQRHSIGGELDPAILTHVGDMRVSDLIGLLSDKKFNDVRKWVAENSVDLVQLCRALYDVVDEHVKPESIPALILILADYQYKSNFVADHEINTMAMLTEIMAETEWRS